VAGLGCPAVGGDRAVVVAALGQFVAAGEERHGVFPHEEAHCPIVTRGVRDRSLDD
jgi:hypothetical protein